MVNPRCAGCNWSLWRQWKERGGTTCCMIHSAARLYVGVSGVLVICTYLLELSGCKEASARCVGLAKFVVWTHFGRGVYQSDLPVAEYPAHWYEKLCMLCGSLAPRRLFHYCSPCGFVGRLYPLYATRGCF